MRGKRPDKFDWEPPACLTDGSNEPLPRDYIGQWRVTDTNKELRMKELVYTINLLKSRGMDELILNPKMYERDFYLLCKGVYKVNNAKSANRLLVFETVTENGVVDLLKDYWAALIADFELKRKDTAEDVGIGQLWAIFTETQRHLVNALFNCYHLLLIFWHTSDLKDEERPKYVYDNLVDFVLNALNTHLYPINVEGVHPQSKMVKACLGIINNLCNRYSECVSDLRKKDALKIVSKYRNTGTSTLKTISIIGCSFLLTETDDRNAIIELEESDINFIVGVLRDALNSPSTISTKYGYHADEVIAGLNNIAVVESNKKRLVDAGVLPLYVEAMAVDKPSLQEKAAQGIWALAFDDDSRCKITDEPGCMSDLKKLADSDNPDVKAAADGALWKIEGESKHINKLSNKKLLENQPAGAGLKHIMISYQWGVKEQVLKLRQRLKTAGYRVWIDVEQMSGSTLQSMAKAVEHSAVFVSVLTEKYKASPACRQEAEYAHHLQKRMVPVRLQPKYRPDGWLGFMLGSTFFYDLTKKEEYDSKVSDFIKELGEDGKIQTGEDENPLYSDVEDEEEDEVGELRPAMSRQSSFLLPRPITSSVATKPTLDISTLTCLSWTRDQVTDWLNENKLGKYTEKFADVDGELMAELIYMRYHSSDVYYDLMKQEHDMKLLDLLKLNAAIRKLAALS